MENFTLVITEKPDAAARIATALDMNGRPTKILKKGFPYYIVKKDRNLVVVPALGHLYTITSESKSRHLYPVFEFKWVPLYQAEPNAKRIRGWLETIEQLARDADTFIDACDYDVEGSIIGYCILKYACGSKQTEAKRMKYSTLTKEEIERSYLNQLPSLDFSLVEAGLARHAIDWLYGVNLSRALTEAAKKHSGRYVALSTGRVQGPTLRFLAKRERSINSFVTTPYWSIKATVRIGDSLFQALYEEGMILMKSKAHAIVRACRGQKGKVDRIETKAVLVPPPAPFDLGTLQSEAYRLFKYTPMRTLSIAQRLYLDALISYPRTSSQKLPSIIGYETILRKLSVSDEHGKLARELLAKSELKPSEGKSVDPAHPAIYPTGLLPARNLEKAEKNIWNLTVRRFMATFADSAARKFTLVTLDISKNRFRIDGKETLEEGWLQFYNPYGNLPKIPLPPLAEGQEIDVKNVWSTCEFTKPPPRYNPSSLLKKMQKENLGTKSTRAGIVQTLYDRKYIAGESIKVTDLGFEIEKVLETYCPTVLSSALTAELEDRMENVKKKIETQDEVVNDVIRTLKPITTMLKEKEDVVGAQLSDTLRKLVLKEKKVGTCLNCKTGELVIMRSKTTAKRFIGCTNYFGGTCKASFPLPQIGSLKPLHVSCSECDHPTVQVWQKGRRPWKLCINPLCPSKKKNLRF